MHTTTRRTVITGVAVSALGLAGCLGSDAAVDETVVNSGEFRFNANEGDTIEISVTNERGFETFVSLLPPNDTQSALDETVETEQTFEYEATNGGAWAVLVDPVERASITVEVN